MGDGGLRTHPTLFVCIAGLLWEPGKKSLSSASPCIRYCDDYCGAEKMAVDANVSGPASGLAGLAGDLSL